MRQLLLYLLISAALLTGCSEETIVKEAPDTDKQTIEFVTLGFAAHPGDENKGFGAFYYGYLNLATDSVFIQKKINPDEQPETFAWAGIVAGVSQDAVITAYLEASKQYRNGEKISEPIEEGALFCGPTYATRYHDAGAERIHYFTTKGLDIRFEQVKNYFIALQKSKLLKPVSTINEDSIVIPIVKLAGPEIAPPPPLLPPPPPPRLPIR